MIGKKRVIEDDLFSIVRRLKEIDSTYFVAFDYKKNRLELHSFAQRGSTLTLVLPNNVLDERTINYVLKTRSERKKELLEEIEKHNKILEKNELDNLRKKMEQETENVYRKL